MRSLSRVLRRRVAGLLLIALGVIALATPLAAGRWSLALLAIPLMALSLVEAYSAFTSPRWTELSAYLPSMLAMLAGNVLLLSSALVLSGMLILLIAFLVIDGVNKLLTAWRNPQVERSPPVVNALIDFGCAALLWVLSHIIGVEQAVGISVGAYIAGAGWRLLMAPVEESAPDFAPALLNVHPDRSLRLPPNEFFARLRAAADSTATTVRGTDLMWMVTLGGVFLAIHLGRMPTADSLLGIVSPFVATAGDLLMTLVFAILVVLPARLVWRRFTRPAERLGWLLYLNAKSEGSRMNLAADWLIGRWLERAVRLRSAVAGGACVTLRCAHPAVATWTASDGILRGIQSDLGLQLVLQHGKLGDRRLSEDDRTEG